MEKQKNINSFLATMEYSSHMKESLESFLAMPKNQKISSASSINNHYHLREGLEIQSESTNSTSFVSDFDIPDITPAAAQPLKTGYTMWRKHCQYLERKNSIPAACNLCEYI